MIKYIQRRINGKPTRLYICIGWCKTCGQPFEKIGRGSNRAYCNICAKNSKRESNRRSEDNRPERNDYKNELRRRLRGEGRIKQDYNQTNQQVCGKPPENPVS